MRFKMDFSKLPKCGAKPKKNSSRTWPCKHIALKAGRCYYHQGRPPKHELYTKKSYGERTAQRHLINEMRRASALLKELVKGG